MKKILLVSSLLCWFLSFFWSPGLALRVRVRDYDCPPGGSFVLQIEVDEATGIAGVDLVLEFDGAILTAGEAETTDLTEGFLIVSNPQFSNIVISLANPTGIPEGEGSIIDIPFEVNRGVVEGETSLLALSDIFVFNEEGLPLPVTTRDGVFFVSSVPVTLTLDPETTSVSREGVLTHCIILVNNTDSPQSFYFLEVLTRESWPGWSRKIFGPKLINLGPHQVVSGELNLFIPSYTPSGTYTYKGYIAKGYSDVWQIKDFDFTVEE